MTEASVKPEVTADAAKKWMGAGEKGGFLGKLAQEGVGGTLKDNFRWEAGNKGMACGRGAGVAAGGAIMADAMFRGKKGNGEDRGAVGRVVQFVAGGGVAAASALAGKGRV